MGIDAYVHLRIKNRERFRKAVEAEDRLPLFRPHEDGSASVFTCIRFEDSDSDLAIRCWLRDLFGDALAEIHDDPRGVFVTPDVAEPKAKTYEGIIEEIGEGGRWIDPTPPTEEEVAARERECDELVSGFAVLRAAAEKGDRELEDALKNVPEHVRESWEEQRAAGERLERAMTTGGGLDLSAFMPPEAIRAFEELAGGAVAALMAQAAEDPRGSGRISAIVPPIVWRLFEEEPRRGGIEVEEQVVLPDGSAIVVTSRLGDDDELMATTLGDLLEREGIDRAALGELPFFRESLVPEIADARDLASAAKRLGDRAQRIRLRTFEEREKEDEERLRDWLSAR